MAIGSLDRDLKELSSTKGQNFAHLIHHYSYRRDQIPEKILAKARDKSMTEILCRMNERVCKKAGIEEVGMTWKSMATLGSEMLRAKQALAAISLKTSTQVKNANLSNSISESKDNPHQSANKMRYHRSSSAG